MKKDNRMMKLKFILVIIALTINNTTAQISFEYYPKVNFYTQDSLYLITEITGDSAGDMFSTVTSVGDVNGDGYDDILVGARDENYAKLFFGGSVFDTIPDIILKGENLTGKFGHSVAGGKDLNGDGYPDFVIGAPLYCYGGCMDGIAEAGKVYIFYGGPELDSIPDMELLSVGWYNRFGWAVSLAEDLNKDGCPDLIVGAPWYGGDAQGRVFIYYGGSGIFDSTADVILDGKNFLDMFGISVSEAGDVNKDGYNDLIIGAPQDLSGLAGEAYLLFGGDEGLTLNNSITFHGDTSLHYGSFGRIVAGLGDLNGDGLSDFGVMGLNVVAVFFGDSLSTSYKTTYLSKNQENGEFVFLALGGDLNIDGYDDLLVSTEKSNNLWTGRAVILHGCEEFDTSKQYDFVGPQPTWRFGSNMVVVGKLSDDLKNCVVVSDDHAFGPNIPGKVYFFKYNSVNFVEGQKESYSSRFQLHQNYPNPFNPTTTVTFELYQREYIKIDLFNIIGIKLKTIIEGVYSPGFHQVEFNGGELSSGVYFYRLIIREWSIQKSMILLK